MVDRVTAPSHSEVVVVVEISATDHEAAAEGVTVTTAASVVTAIVIATAEAVVEVGAVVVTDADEPSEVNPSARSKSPQRST